MVAPLWVCQSVNCNTAVNKAKSVKKIFFISDVNAQISLVQSICCGFVVGLHQYEHKPSRPRLRPYIFQDQRREKKMCETIGNAGVENAGLDKV